MIVKRHSYDPKYDKNDNLKTPSSICLCIPRAYAREETKEIPEDASEVPHYELYITKQIGTWKNKRDADVYFKLPKSGRLIRIILHYEQGASYDNKYHTMLIRETDELDRRIVLGFCIKYSHLLRELCYAPGYNDISRRDRLITDARYYNVSMMQKRLKPGPRIPGITCMYPDDFKDHSDENPLLYCENTYSNSGIFKYVKFI